jgi:hypothetical protein
MERKSSIGRRAAAECEFMDKIRLAATIEVLRREQPEKFFDWVAETAGLKPLLDASRFLPEYSKAVASFQSAASAELDFFSKLPDEDPASRKLRLVEILMRNGEALDWTNIDLELLGSDRERLKKQHSRVSNPSRFGRSNAVGKPMVFLWVGAVLWLCDEASGATLVEHAMRAYNVKADHYGVHRRMLSKSGLWWTMPPGIVKSGSGKPAMAKGLRYELETKGADVQAAAECLDRL